MDALDEARRLAESHSKAREAEREDARRLREMCRNLKTRIGQLEKTIERYKVFLPKQDAENEQLRKTIKALELELLERPTEPGKGPEPMKIVQGSVFGEKPVTDEVVEGERYVRVLELFENAGAPGSVVLGDPVSFPAPINLLAKAKVTGTGAELFIRAVLTDLGSATEPAKVLLRMEASEVKKALVDGGLQEFRWDLQDQDNEDNLASALVEVIPSAFGATR